MGESNVIRLADVRRLRAEVPNKRLFYLSDQNELSPLLSSYPDLRVESVRSQSTLETKNKLYQADLFIIESDLTWADPVGLVRFLHHSLQVPIVMIAKDSESADTQNIIKEAYAAGLYDLFYSPICKEDLCAALRVLLRLPRIQSSQH